jgi:hypothetical protein
MSNCFAEYAKEIKAIAAALAGLLSAATIILVVEIPTNKK